MIWIISKVISLLSCPQASWRRRRSASMTESCSWRSAGWRDSRGAWPPNRRRRATGLAPPCRPWCGSSSLTSRGSFSTMPILKTCTVSWRTVGLPNALVRWVSDRCDFSPMQTQQISQTACCLLHHILSFRTELFVFVQVGKLYIHYRLEVPDEKPIFESEDIICLLKDQKELYIHKDHLSARLDIGRYGICPVASARYASQSSCVWLITLSIVAESWWSCSPQKRPLRKSWSGFSRALLRALTWVKCLNQSWIVIKMSLRPWVMPAVLLQGDSVLVFKSKI